jgi:CubicO group peptidase (beta-lactamase class C family)
MAGEPTTAPNRLASRLAGFAAAAPKKRSLRARAAVPRTIAALGAFSSPPIPPRYQAFAAAFDLDARQSAVPGAVVALIEHGAVTFTHGYGTAGLNSTAPVDADTIFRVGLMTEPLTAAVALALIDAGKGSLDEPVATAVPGVSLSGAYVSSLTMRHLLSNQSGLFDFTGWGSDPDLLSTSCSPDPTTLKSFVTGPVFSQNALFMSPPGAIYTASNTNFILAGAAIEDETGALFPDAMKSVLFAPLGMNRTFFLPSDVASAGNYATGTTYDSTGNPVPLADYDCAAYRPFGTPSRRSPTTPSSSSSS